MTSFSSRSMAHPTGRLSCSTTSGLWPPVHASVTDQCPPPHPRGPHAPPGSSSSPCWSPCSLPGFGPALELCGERTGEGPGWAIFLLLEAGLPWLCSATPRDPRALGLRGACRRSQKRPSRQALSLKGLDSASCQSRGACHPLPTTCLLAACPLTTPA